MAMSVLGGGGGGSGGETYVVSSIRYSHNNHCAGPSARHEHTRYCLGRCRGYTLFKVDLGGYTFSERNSRCDAE